MTGLIARQVTKTGSRAAATGKDNRQGSGELLLDTFFNWQSGELLLKHFSSAAQHFVQLLSSFLQVSKRTTQRQGPNYEL